jgi:hypothetical protein
MTKSLFRRLLAAAVTLMAIPGLAQAATTLAQVAGGCPAGCCCCPPGSC